MRSLVQVSKPLRYRALTDVAVYDVKGLFYIARRGKEFNLPYGNYVIQGKTKRIPFRMPAVPNLRYYKPEKNVGFKGFQKVIFTQNPNKCSIDVQKGFLVFDKDFFKSLNISQLYFVLSHEVGHFFYYTEHKCDTFAAFMMLKMGFNPSQISSAAKSTLISDFRKKENEYNLII